MTTGRGSVVLCVLVLCLGTDAAASQEMVVPVPGTLIRITAPTVIPVPMIGTLLDSTERELVISRETGKEVIPRDAITKIEWSYGRRRNARRGAIWGAVIMGGTFAVMGAASEPEPSGYGDFINVCSSRGACAATMGVTGAVGGAFYGALIGLLIKTYDWNEAPRRSVRVTVTPEKGVGVRAAITFAW